MWPIILSNRLPIVALVGRYPANKLMGRGLIPARKLASRGLLSPHCTTRAYPVLSTVSSRYSSCRGRLSTRYSPVRHSTRGRSPFRVRLACVKHAASVQSEPESNSPELSSSNLFKISARQKSESQSCSLPVRSSLVNEPGGLASVAVPRGVGLYAPFPRGCQQLFFRASKKLFGEAFLSPAATTGEVGKYSFRPPLSTLFFVVCKISFASRQRIKRRSPFYASAGRASTSFLPIRARCPAQNRLPLCSASSLPAPPASGSGGRMRPAPPDEPPPEGTGQFPFRN